MDDNKELVEKMLVAFLTEKSAQCGEPFYMDMWEEYKRDKPEAYHEEFVQMQAALSIIQPELQKRDEALEQIKRISKDYGIEVEYKYKESELAHCFYKLHFIAESALKTTTGHEGGGNG